MDFKLNPESHVLILQEQRNKAMDDAAMWKAVALQERQRVEELEAAAAATPPAS